MNAQTTIQQLGGQGLSGALVYTGTKQMISFAPTDKHDGEMWCQVNGRRGFHTYIVVRLEYNDTYTLELVSKRGKQKTAVYSLQNDVYCDELQHYFEQMYDIHMQQHNKGFIPVS